MDLQCPELEQDIHEEIDTQLAKSAPAVLDFYFSQAHSASSLGKRAQVSPVTKDQTRSLSTLPFSLDSSETKKKPRVSTEPQPRVEPKVLDAAQAYGPNGIPHAYLKTYGFNVPQAKVTVVKDRYTLLYHAATNSTWLRTYTSAGFKQPLAGTVFEGAMDEYVRLLSPDAWGLFPEDVGLFTGVDLMPSPLELGETGARVTVCFLHDRISHNYDFLRSGPWINPDWQGEQTDVPCTAPNYRLAVTQRWSPQYIIPSTVTGFVTNAVSRRKATVFVNHRCPEGACPGGSVKERQQCPHYLMMHLPGTVDFDDKTQCPFKVNLVTPEHAAKQLSLSDILSPLDLDFAPASSAFLGKLMYAVFVYPMEEVHESKDYMGMHDIGGVMNAMRLFLLMLADDTVIYTKRFATCLAMACLTLCLKLHDESTESEAKGSLRERLQTMDVATKFTLTWAGAQNLWFYVLSRFNWAVYALGLNDPINAYFNPQEPSVLPQGWSSSSSSAHTGPALVLPGTRKKGAVAADLVLALGSASGNKTHAERLAAALARDNDIERASASAKTLLEAHFAEQRDPHARAQLLASYHSVNRELARLRKASHSDWAVVQNYLLYDAVFSIPGDWNHSDIFYHFAQLCGYGAWDLRRQYLEARVQSTLSELYGCALPCRAAVNLAMRPSERQRRSVEFVKAVQKVAAEAEAEEQRQVLPSPALSVARSTPSPASTGSSMFLSPQSACGGVSRPGSTVSDRQSSSSSSSASASSGLFSPSR